MTAAALTGRPTFLIALDIDGTVLLEDDTLSPGVVEAVRAARDGGAEVMLATGRSWSGTESVLGRLGILPEYVVCSNGAVVMKLVDAPRREYVRWHTETFDPTAVLLLLREHLPGARFMVELPNGDRLYTEPIAEWNINDGLRVDFDELIGKAASRVVVVEPERSEADFLELIERIGLNQVSYAIGWTAWLDVAPMGVDKGSALELVREWLEIPRDRVVVMGDGRNDMGMFEWALAGSGRAIAMGQASEDVIGVAGELTLPVDEGGVAAILNTLA